MTDLNKLMAVRRLMAENAGLMKAVKEWYDRCPFEFGPKKTEDEWINALVGHCHDEAAFGRSGATLAEVYAAVCVQCGFVSGVESAKAEITEHGLEFDTNSYVEEGRVWFSVWLKGTEPAEVEKVANSVKGLLEVGEFGADVRIDDEDAREAVVFASMPIGKYAVFYR